MTDRGATLAFAFPGHLSPDAGVATAVELASLRNSRLTLLSIAVAAPWPCRASLCFVPVNAKTLRLDAIEQAEASCRELLSGVPPDLPVEFAVRYGKVGTVVEEAFGRRPDLAGLALHRELLRCRLLRRSLRGWVASGLPVHVG